MRGEIKPIRTEADHAGALKTIEKLWGAKHGTPEGDRLEVLMVLVEAYEIEHHPIDPPSPIEAISFRMEQMGLTRKDLEPFIGSRARVSEVMNGKRPLSIEMIRRLHADLGIPAVALIGKSELQTA